MTSNVALDVEPPAPSADLLSIEQIRRRLVTDRVGFQIYLFGEVSSTNDVLRHLATAAAADGTVVLAESQTMGRGRLGKPWFSPPGVNLYASILLRPAIEPVVVPAYAFIASLAVTEAIWVEGGPASIKWPNDVLVEDRKVGGTLVTYATAGDRVGYVILGVGVNLNVDRATLRSGLGPTAPDATSVREAVGHPVDRNAFTAALLNFVEKWDDEYRWHGAVPILAALRERDALRGRTVRVVGSGDACCGTARGVTDRGRLIVEGLDGVHHEVTSGEVTATVAPPRRPCR